MAQNTSDHLTYLMSVPLANLTDLGNLRQWDNLKVGFEGNLVWVKDFTFVQLDSVVVKSIPSKQIYSITAGKLYPQNSLLPAGNMPTPLWTPIQRAIALDMPPLNHHFFGIEDKIPFQLVPSDIEKPPVGMLLPIATLENAASNIAEIRLAPLQWIMLDETQVFVLGTPLLPLQAPVFWRKNNFLIPVGYDFDLHILVDTMDTIINPGASNWVVWHANSTYYLLKKQMFVPLSLGSIRLTHRTNP
jgi:MoxR-vWA-beta-propeller ternary system domain bpX2